MTVTTSVRESDLAALIRDHCATIPNPRVVSAGHRALPTRLIGLVDSILPEYRLNILNAPSGIPTRPGVVH